MTENERVEKIDRRKLPLFYKIILKLPLPTIVRSIDIPSGIFWAIIVPIFMIVDFYLNIYFLVGFSFPVNLILLCIVPLMVLVIFVRVTADRFIDWWNSAIVGGYVQREFRAVLNEYVLIQKDKEKEQARSECV